MNIIERSLTQNATRAYITYDLSLFDPLLLQLWDRMVSIVIRSCLKLRPVPHYDGRSSELSCNCSARFVVVEISKISMADRNNVVWGNEDDDDNHSFGSDFEAMVDRIADHPEHFHLPVAIPVHAENDLLPMDAALMEAVEAIEEIEAVGAEIRPLPFPARPRNAMVLQGEGADRRGDREAFLMQRRHDRHQHHLLANQRQERARERADERGARNRAMLNAIRAERMEAARVQPPAAPRRGLMNLFRWNRNNGQAQPADPRPQNPPIAPGAGNGMDDQADEMMRMMLMMAQADMGRANEPPPFDNRFLFDLVREDLSCYLHTGNPNRNCQTIVRFCTETPEAIHFLDHRTRRTPLHEAALRCSCIHTIRALVETTHERIPQASSRLMANDADGNCPLQLYLIGMGRKSVMAMDTTSDVLDILINTPPNNIPARQNRRGNNSLHLACSAPESMVPSFIIETFLSRISGGPTIQNRDLKTPLHVHCDRPDASVEVARLMVENKPDFNFPRDQDGKAPIHYAAQRNNGPLVEYLIQAKPACVFTQTTDAKNVLHLFKGIEPKTLELILRKAPRLVSCQTTETLMNPLHTLLADSRLTINPKVVRMMVVENQEILMQADRYGFLPIHYACRTSRDPEIVRLLLTGQSAAAVTLKNDTALSLAASQNASVETVQMLIEACESALKKANDYGFLPLHCVCRAQRPKETIIRALIDAFSEARQMQTHAGELPLHLAHKGASKASLHVLGHDENSSSAFDALVSKNKVGNTPRTFMFLHNFSRLTHLLCSSHCLYQRGRYWKHSNHDCGPS